MRSEEAPSHSQEPQLPAHVNCPDCGKVSVEPDAYAVRICTDNHTASYYFPCPGCEVRTSKTIPYKLARDLGRIGVTVEYWELPAELRENRELRESPAQSQSSADSILDVINAFANDPDSLLSARAEAETPPEHHG